MPSFWCWFDGTASSSAGAAPKTVLLVGPLDPASETVSNGWPAWVTLLLGKRRIRLCGVRNWRRGGDGCGCGYGELGVPYGELGVPYGELGVPYEVVGVPEGCLPAEVDAIECLS